MTNESWLLFKYHQLLDCPKSIQFWRSAKSLSDDLMGSRIKILKSSLGRMEFVPRLAAAMLVYIVKFASMVTVQYKAIAVLIHQRAIDKNCMWMKE
eukprot:9914524-Ditylum_brightwellii.AAC.1